MKCKGMYCRVKIIRVSNRLTYHMAQLIRIVGVNVETRQAILEELPVVESEEQRRIRELEDELLLQADAELGGIL